MANTLRFKRGLVSTIPTALAGEPLFTTDTFDLYIGNGTTNTRFQKYIASGTTSQLLRGDGSLLTMPIVLTSPANGQVLKYNGTSWVNDSDAGITGSGAAGQVAYFTGATTQSGSNNLFWDNANGRLGIGTNVPSFPLHVSGVGYITGNVNIGSSSQQKVTQFGGAATGLTIASATYPVLSLWDTGDANWNFSLGINDGLAYVANLANGAIEFQTNASTKMRLHAGGNLHLGGTSDNGLRFQVTGDGYFSGSVGIGTTTLTAISLRVSKNLTGAVSSIGIVQEGQVQTDVTSAATGFRNLLNTAASTTLGDYYHIRLGQGTIGAGTTLTQQIGLYINDFANGTNRYGILSELSAGTGKWNLYMNGTAANYLNGNLGVGITTPTARVEAVGVSGTTLIRATGADANGNADVEIRSTGTTGSSRLFFGDTAATSGSIIYNHASDAMLFSTAAATRMTLTAVGRLILGAGDSGELLQVNGTMKVTGASTFGSSIISSGLISAATEFRLNNNTFSRVAKIDAQGGFAGGYNVDIIAGPTVTHAETGAISGIRYAGNGNLFFFTNTSQAAGTTATTRMTLDTSGNLGLAVTPSATSGTYKNVQNGLATMMGSTSDASAYWNANATFNSGWKYIANGTSTRYEQGTGHFWFIAPSGTAGNAISYTQAMTLHSTGNLAIGTGSGADAGFRLDVNGTMRVSGASTLSGGVTLGHTGGVAVTFPGGQAFRSNGGIFIDYGNGGSGDLVFRRGAGVTNTLTLAVADGAATFSSSVTAGGNLLLTNGTASSIGAINLIRTGTSPVASRLTFGTDGTGYSFAISKNQGGTITDLLTILDTGATTFLSSVRAAGFNSSGGNGYQVINSASNTVTALRPTGGGASIMSTNSNGLHIAVGTEASSDLIFASNNTERIRLSSNGFFSQLNATNPSASITDSYIQYSADVVAGNAAPHFRTENGAIIKLYQETTAVGNSIISLGGGNAVLDDTTFDGYTLRQIVKALRNQGILA